MAGAADPGCLENAISCAYEATVGAATSAVASSASDSVLDSLGHAINSALVSMISSLGTFWVQLPTPDLTTFGGSGNVAAGTAAPGSDNLLALIGWTSWVGVVLAALSLIVLLASIASGRRRGEGGAWTGHLLAVFAGAVVIVSAAQLARFFTPTAPTAGSGTVAFISNATWYPTVIVAVISVIIGGTKMALQQRAQPGLQTFQGIINLILVSTVGVLVISTLADAADAFSRWILSASMTCDPGAGGDCFASNMALLLPSLLTPGQTGLTGFLLVVLSFIALSVTFVQVLLMLLRVGMLVLMTGLLPLPASASGTELGRAWFRKYLAWLAAFLLYKPVAALIYAAAFRLAGTNAQNFAADSSGVVAVVSGLALLTVAIVALPVLLKFAVPVMSAVSGGDGGGAGLAAAVALPTGAISLGREAGKLMSGGGGGQPPSGAAPSPSGSTGSGGGPSTPAAPRPSSAGSGPGGAAAAPSSSGAAGGGAGAAAGGAGAAGAGAAGAGAAGAGTTAGAAGGPVGMAVGAAVGQGVSAATSAVQGAVDGARSAASSSADPTGSGEASAPAGPASSSQDGLPDGSR